MRSSEKVKGDKRVANAALRLLYGTTTVSNQYEYQLYDLGTTQAAVGGSMGIFLEFSFFHCGRRIIKTVSDKRLI
jgi:hypothetical protein